MHSQLVIRSTPLRANVLGSTGLLLSLVLLCVTQDAISQGSATLGNGLSAAATARGGSTVAEHANAIDAVEGNPAGFAGISVRSIDLNVIGLAVGGSFRNAANSDSKPTGIAGALPYGAFATPLGKSHWSASAAVTPELLMRANWHYNDTPGTAGVTYGNQTQEAQIIAVRSSLGFARTLGSKWATGVTLGVVYNYNDLHAPFIFQQQSSLKGLKVSLDLTTRGYGWNGGAGVQWQPSPRLRAGLAWKSGTTIRTQGSASGSASALFEALGIKADPNYSYQAQVMNHLPQAFDAGARWQRNQGLTLTFQGDFTAWGQAFQQLPVTLTKGSNATINGVVGANHFVDTVPLHWNNQATFHAGAELPVRESVILRSGYSYATNPVPNSTLTPLTAAIMRNSIATGGGWTYGRWHYDAAYQVQLPAMQLVGQSGLLAGEYSNSRVRIWTQSVTLSTRVKF
jgi:long-subunit fatty acid transport protein